MCMGQGSTETHHTQLQYLLGVIRLQMESRSVPMAMALMICTQRKLKRAASINHILDYGFIKKHVEHRKTILLPRFIWAQCPATWTFKKECFQFTTCDETSFTFVLHTISTDYSNH